MKYTRLIKCIGVFLMAVLTQAMAQEKVTVQKGVNQRGVYKTENITAYVEGHQTKIEVLGLFKPEEITMKRELSPSQTMDHLTLKIKVKDPNHPVIKYYDNKARLYYKGKWYAHNDIPEINGDLAKKIEYHPSQNELPGEENYISVSIYGEEYQTGKKFVFRSAPKKILYYAVDRKIIPAEEVPKLHLEAGSFTSETLFGKEAVERFGDTKYSEGIVVIKRK